MIPKQMVHKVIYTWIFNAMGSQVNETNFDVLFRIENVFSRVYTH